MEEEEAGAAATMAEGGDSRTAGTRVEEPRTAPALKVVAAVDASEESLHALSWVLDNILRGHPDAELIVVHAQNFVEHFVYPVAGHDMAIAYAPTAALESMRKAQEETSRKIVARALKICEAKQVNATAAVVEGDAKEAICQAVDRMQAGLLILGSRGLGKIKRAFLGSVSDYLTHHASCPVLVVKPPKAQGK